MYDHGLYSNITFVYQQPTSSSVFLVFITKKKMFFFPTIKREKFNQNRHQTNKVFFSFSSFTVIPATAPKLFFFFLQMTKSLSYGERIAIAARLAAIYARSLPAEKQPSFRTNMNNFITAGKFISENHGPFVDESSCQTVAQTIQKAVFREMYQCEIKKYRVEFMFMFPESIGKENILSCVERLEITRRLVEIYASSLPSKKGECFRSTIKSFLEAGKSLFASHHPLADQNTSQMLVQDIQAVVFQEMLALEIEKYCQETEEKNTP